MLCSFILFKTQNLFFFLFVNQHEKAFLALTAPETNMEKKRQKASGSLNVEECIADVKLQQMYSLIRC